MDFQFYGKYSESQGKVFKVSQCIFELLIRLEYRVHVLYPGGVSHALGHGCLFMWTICSGRFAASHSPMFPLR